MMVALGIIIVLVGWLTIGLVVAVLYGDSAKQRDAYVDVDHDGPTDGASNREERAA